MIAMIMPLAVGNALRVFLEPPAVATKWRLLRKAADTFTGPDDASAFLAYEGTDRIIVDAANLQNGAPQFYRAYYWDGVSWLASASAVGTANSTYEDCSTDVLETVRDRLTVGLIEEVRRKTVQPNAGLIRVLTAPPVYEDTRWPMVSVHLMSEQPSVRAVGELVESDVFDTDEWNEHEGWLAHVQLAIVGWHQNPDERIAMRKALRRIIVGNLPVFDAKGMLQIEFSQQDVDAVSGEYPAPVYQAACTLTCLAPVVVRSKAGVVTDVESSISPE